MNLINKITSRDNARLVHVRKIRDGKVRDEIFLEGLRLVEEALRSDVKLVEAFFTPEFAGSGKGAEMIESLSSMNAGMVEIPETLFGSISGTKSSQGIVVTVPRPTTGDEQFSSQDPGLFVYLHKINDPSNLGAIFRTTEAAGVAGVIISTDSADPFSPKALRAAMGASLRLSIWDKANANDVFEWAAKMGLKTVAADVNGAKTYSEIDWAKPSLVIFGSEAHGLEREFLARVDETFRIPMKNHVESLNLAVSAGIILFEAVRQGPTS